MEGLESIVFKIQEESAKIYCSLISGELTKEQYSELYSAQQALSWVLGIGASPYETVMTGKVYIPEDLILKGIPVN